MRFASHRDIARAVERGVRRAGLPIAYSAGFTPHPKISYAGAAPTGTASEAEYLELSLTQRCTAPEVRERLDAALPDGMDVIEVTEAAPSLAALPLEASHWQVVLPGVQFDEAARAADEFLDRQSVEVERLTSKGLRRMDARAAVVSLAAEPGLGGRPSGSPGAAGAAAGESVGAAAGDLAGGGAGVGSALGAGFGVAKVGAAGGAPVGPERMEFPGAADAADRGPAAPHGDAAGNVILRMVVRHVTPAVRPDDILAALRSVAGLAPSSPPVVTRLAQGALDEVISAAGLGSGLFEPPEAGSGAAPTLGVPGEQMKTTRHGEGTAGQAGSHLAGACNQLLRGAEGPERAAAPGSLTGDSPDARERAERQRIRQ
jgi:radical SAM-linked protein